MENNNSRIHYEIAVERVKNIRKFYTSVVVFIIIFGVIYGIRFFKYGFSNLDHIQVSWIFIIWGLLLAIRGFKLFFLNSDWEKEMINKELKKQNNGNYSK